jgi:plasmid segregation protein ParM
LAEHLCGQVSIFFQFFSMQVTAMDVFKEFVETVVSKLQVEYSLRSQDVMLTGGGSQLMFSALKKRLPNATLMPNPVFANAIGLKKVGDSVWH